MIDFLGAAAGFFMTGCFGVFAPSVAVAIFMTSAIVTGFFGFFAPSGLYFFCAYEYLCLKIGKMERRECAGKFLCQLKRM